MKHHSTGNHTARSAHDWDLKLAAILFIGTCATMSLILPNWQSPLDAAPMADEAEATPAATPLIAAVPAAAAVRPPPPSSAQRQAALSDYRAGLDQLHKGRYDAASTDFKKALEKSADLAEAYIGLGDAFIHLKDYKAAETNGRHALSMLKLAKVGQAPDPALKKELAYAHQVLGVALLHLAQEALEQHDGTAGRMQALEAGSHCSLANVFDQSDQTAHACTQQANALTAQM